MHTKYSESNQDDSECLEWMEGRRMVGSWDARMGTTRPSSTPVLLFACPLPVRVCYYAVLHDNLSATGECARGVVRRRGVMVAPAVIIAAIVSSVLNEGIVPVAVRTFSLLLLVLWCGFVDHNRHQLNLQTYVR